MSATADMSSSSFGIASGIRGVSRPFDLLGGRHGSCLWCVIMSGAARHRDRWLPVLLLAAFLVITLGSDAAWPAMGGGHGGGHGGGFGGGRPGGSFSGGRGFGGGRFGGRSFPHGAPRPEGVRLPVLLRSLLRVRPVRRVLRPVFTLVRPSILLLGRSVGLRAHKEAHDRPSHPDARRRSVRRRTRRRRRFVRKGSERGDLPAVPSGMQRSEGAGGSRRRHLQRRTARVHD